MQITLSAALTSDGYLDDSSSSRLMISTSGDWDAVMRLRAQCDAILVGAETVRRDNPSLLLHDETMRAVRKAKGLSADLTKVTLTTSGSLSPDAYFFQYGDCEKIVFSSVKIPEIEKVATVIYTDGPVSAAQLVTTLEQRCIGHLLVEGGASILQLFLSSHMADTLRLAINPRLTLGVERGGAHFDFGLLNGLNGRHESCDGMDIATYTLRPDTRCDDLRYINMALDESRKCQPSQTSYCVGAVVIAADGRCFTGHTHETSATHHAEQEAIAKALHAGAVLQGGSIYTSMEPCSKRASEPESCTQLILRYGFSHVAFALYEPDRFVRCEGALQLREAGVDVRTYPELGDSVRKTNAHLLI